jgi:hypothetical protein
LAAVEGLLRQLIEQSAEMLGIDRMTLDELRAIRLISRDDLKRRWPMPAREALDVGGRAERRLRLLRDLNDQAKLLGLELGLGGALPPDLPPEPGGLAR